MPNEADTPSSGNSDQGGWDIDKARTVGEAVQQSLYSPNHGGSEGIKGHPAEEGFRANSENAFEQFYNLDPERFAQMPTSEFIKAAREYSKLEEMLSDAQARRDQFLKEYGIGSN
jgi:hypothetical protein